MSVNLVESLILVNINFTHLNGKNSPNSQICIKFSIIYNKVTVSGLFDVYKPQLSHEYTSRKHITNPIRILLPEIAPEKTK